MNFNENNNSLENTTKTEEIENTNTFSDEEQTFKDMSPLNNIDDNSEITYQNKKTKTKRIIIGLTALLSIILISFGIRILIRNNNAKKALSYIDNLVNQQNYQQAYIEYDKFIKEHNFGKFPEIAEEKKEELIHISQKQFREGLKKLQADESYNFSDSKNYFNSFKIDYAYDTESVEKADAILALIDEYEKTNELYWEAKEFMEGLNALGDVVSIIEDYILEIDKLHVLSDSVINQGQVDFIDVLLSDWYNNREYYYSIYDDVENFAKNDYNNNFFSDEGYETILNCLNLGMLPAEAYFNMYYGITYYNDTQLELIRQSWAEYEVVKSQVFDMIETSREAINSYSENLSLWEQHLNEIYDNLKNFSLENYEHPEGESF